MSSGVYAFGAFRDVHARMVVPVGNGTMTGAIRAQSR